MPDSEDNWIQAERRHAQDYLLEQQIEHLGVGDYPAFHVHPYLALWAVQSERSPGWIGWWVITGDVPADYIIAGERRHPREALRAFAHHWQELSGFMLRGEEHPDVRIGTPDQWPELGDQLRRRAEIIQRYADDDEIWAEDANGSPSPRGRGRAFPQASFKSFRVAGPRKKRQRDNFRTRFEFSGWSGGL